MLSSGMGLSSRHVLQMGRRGDCGEDDLRFPTVLPCSHVLCDGMPCEGCRKGGVVLQEACVFEWGCEGTECVGEATWGELVAW